MTDRPAGDRSSSEGPRDGAEERRRQIKRVARRRWNEAHPDRVADQKAKYQAAHRREINARERARKQLVRLERQRKKDRDERRQQQAEKRREYNRRYAEAHRESGRERQRAYLARRYADKPVEFQEHRNQLQRAWYARHRDDITANARDAYWADPRSTSEKSRRYYERHAEHIKQRRRDAYRQDPEKILAYNRAWKAKERRRQKEGLPPRRLHRVRPAERDHNMAQAQAFFVRARTEDERRRIRAERVTPAEVRKRLERDSARARAIDYERNAAIAARRLEGRRRETAHLREELFRALREAGTTPEEKRMDEIGRAVNAQLRSRPEQRRVHHNDPAAPYAPIGAQPRPGLSR